MARTVSVKLMADAADFNRKIRGASTDVKSLAKELNQANRAGNLDALGDRAASLGVGLVGAAGAAIKMRADFDKAMSGVRAATHAGSEDMDRLRRAALQAGKDTSFSATEAAQGVEELAKAGVSTSAILGGGLKGALDLAAAGGLDVGQAAETAASALTQFKLQGKDVPHVADLLAAAAGKAQGSVGDMGQALNQAGLIAAGTGLTIEDTTGTLAAFASAGLIGSDAGTSFKTMLQALQAPSGKTLDLMNELGISAYDASGQFIGITALAGQLKTQLGKLTPELRANAMAQIFGSDATRAANILYEQGAEGIQTWIGKTNDAGYAAETAAIKTDNLAGDIERLTGSVQTLAIESGGGANSGLRVLAKSANGLVDQFALLPSGIGGTITVLAALGGAVALGGAGWVKMRRSTADALEELRNTGPAGTRAAAGLQTTTKWAGRAAVAFAATQAAAAGVNAAFGSSVNPQTEALAQSLADWAKNGAMAGEATRVLGDDFKHLGYDLGTLDSGFWTGLGNGISGTVESLTGLGSVADESLQHARERLEGLDAALTQMVTAGNGQDAAQIFDKLAAEADKSGVSVNELKKGLPGYAAALQTAGTQSITTANQVATVGESAEDAEKRVQGLKDAFDELFGSQMSVDRANLKYVEGMGSLTKELTTGRRELGLNTEEGRKNRTAVLDQIDTIDDLRQSRIKHGDTLEEAGRLYLKDIAGLRKSMQQAGFTKKQIDGLIGSYEDIPNKVDTKVSVTGDKAALGKLANLKAYQDALKQGSSVVSIRKQLSKDNADFLKFDTGGRTPSVGIHEPAGVVHGQEFVLDAKTVKNVDREAPGFLEEMHASHRLPGYAGGGRVAWPFPTTAAGTKIPSAADVANAVTPAAPAGGRTSDWIVATVKARFPGIDVLSKDRPGARTLSGNVSYHARGRAVDFEPSRELAGWWDANYRSQTKELISPYQQYNIHNGQRHRYTGAVWQQHNFAGGNAHDHIAMANGGVISEPIAGVGASGRTYSFGERGVETVTPGYLPANAGGGQANVTYVIQMTNSGVIGSQYELDNWLTKSVNRLQQRGRN
ncbi:phage tail tape measure protein [Actinoplanes sp. NPDC048791]|uniref:phage tail tape measure protein n=1 Tax=Actinoplanes sp. NPDC048791 TaxID=3154623 RepID=UPI0033C9E5FD